MPDHLTDSLANTEWFGWFAVIVCPDCKGAGDHCGRCFGTGEIEVYGMFGDR